VALVDLVAGMPIDLGGLPGGLPPGLTARTAVPRGHKVTLRDLREGETVCKSGLPIGQTSVAVAAGSHLHSHNLRFHSAAVARPRLLRNARPLPSATGATFEGYVRADGRVGTRNVLLVMATVNCSATVVRQIAAAFRATVDLTACPTIDGVVALTHQHGCSVRADGVGMELLRRTLAGYARHPNVGGVLVVGLGCEDNQVELFLATSGLLPSDRLAVRVIQQEGGTAATIAAGVAALRSMLQQTMAARRTSVPAARLVVGLQCGGSDGFSTISANPAVGIAADRLVAEGGTVILSETPEIYGASDGSVAVVARSGAAGRRHARQQPLARQQGRGDHHDPGEIAGRGRQGGIEPAP
jgi:altronate hydrolase